MKRMIQFAAVVVLAFIGMVIARESSRREEAPKQPTARAEAATGQVALISTGETVKIEDHLEASAWTVVEFTADW